MTERSTTPSGTEQCEACEGSGRVPVGEHFVTREMAIDAGDRAMEGMSMGIEYGPCPECSGTGEKREQ
jgi:DnaJ-class molecular chaperone